MRYILQCLSKLVITFAEIWNEPAGGFGLKTSVRKYFVSMFVRLNANVSFPDIFYCVVPMTTAQHSYRSKLVHCPALKQNFAINRCLAPFYLKSYSNWWRDTHGPLHFIAFQFALSKKMNEAAVLIQSKFRSYQEQKRFQRSRHAAILIQSFYRSYKCARACKPGGSRSSKHTVKLIEDALRLVRPSSHVLNLHGP